MDDLEGGISRSGYLLDFHREILKELYGYDSQTKEDLVSDPQNRFLILSEGLGLCRILLFMQEVHSNSKNLVILLNTDSQDVLLLREWFLELILNEDINGGIVKSIGQEIPPSERLKLYKEGGLVSVTSRILVVDLLKKVISSNDISGIIVNNCHDIMDLSIESLILKIYRRENKSGFIKAISDKPSSFTSDLGKLERTAGLLFQRHVYLWPRFHVGISSCLNNACVSLTEIRVHSNEKLEKIQAGLLDCCEQCIKELKKTNSFAGLEDIDLDAILQPNFNTLLKSKLTPYWHKVNQKTKQIVSDLRDLRSLLNYYLSFSCVKFYTFLKMIATSNYSLKEEDTNYSWLMLDAAQPLFTLAKERVYKRQGNDTIMLGDIKLPPGVIPILEEQPKWRTLRKVVNAIIKQRDEIISNNRNPGPILVTTSDLETCIQVRDILQDINFKEKGKKAPKFLLKELRDHFYWETALKSLKTEAKPTNETSPKYKKRRMQQTARPSDLLQFTNEFNIEADFEYDIAEKNFDISTMEMECDFIHIHAYSQSERDAKLLDDLKPEWIVIYDMNTRFIRQVEVHSAMNCERKIKIYSMVYSDSIEEQKYLSQIRKEKTSFERLIREASTMAIPLDLKGTLFSDALDSRDVMPSSRKIIVDLREFRCSLPPALYEKGAEIIPATIEIGDYVLSPDIVVERKSLADILESFASGRLYSQVKAMSQHYKIPILLIEWSRNQSFSFNYTHHVRGEIFSKEIQSKIVLLCLHFPKLKILWASSPEASAEMLLDLKKSQPDPDVIDSAKAGVEGNANPDQNFSIIPTNVLLSLPAVTPSNYRNITSKVNNVRDLAQKDESWYRDNLIPDGKKLWEFLNFNVH